MTQGDIHNRSNTFKRLQNQIETSPDISDRDKDLLIHGTDQAPSFVAFMQNQGLSPSRINRYLRTWKRLLERVDWQIEEANKTKLTEYVGQLQTDQFKKKNGEPYSPSTKREIKKRIRKVYTDYVENHKNDLNVPKDFDSDGDISN